MQILVVVANIQTRALKTEVEKVPLTAVEHGSSALKIGERRLNRGLGRTSLVLPRAIEESG